MGEVTVLDDENKQTRTVLDDEIRQVHAAIDELAASIRGLEQRVDQVMTERDALRLIDGRMRAVIEAAQTALYDAMHAGHLSRDYHDSVAAKIDAALASSEAKEPR